MTEPLDANAGFSATDRTLPGPAPTRGCGTVPRAHDAAAAAVLVAFITLLFFDVLFLGRSIGSGDLLQYHFPLKKALRDLVFAGEFPWWNRLIEAGQPIAANPAYELWYPLQWLVFLPGFVIGFKLHVVVHYYVGALGMYALCRALRFRPVTGVIAGSSFAAGGPLISSAGYLPFLFTLAWLPWVLCFALRYRTAGRKVDLALASVAFAMQLLIGEPVVIIQSVVLLFAGAIALRRLRMAIAIILVGAALGAVQLVPAIDHVRDSVRSIPLDYAAVSTWSTSVARPLELFVASKPFAPRRFVGPQRPFITSIYLGLGVVLLAIAGIAARIRGWWAVALFTAASYAVAIGSHTPLLRLLYAAHLFSSIRYPEKFLFGALFVLVVFAAAAFERLLDGDQRIRRAMLAASALVAIAALVCAAVSSPRFVQWSWMLTSSPPRAIVALDRLEWLAAAGRATLLVALLLVVPRRRLGKALALFVIADVGLADSGMVLRVPDRFYGDPPPLLRQLPPPGERLFHQVALERSLGLRPMRGSPLETRWLVRNEMVPYIPAAWGREMAMSYDYDETTLFPSRRLRVAGEIARQRGARSWPVRFMALSNAPWRTVPLDPQTAVREAAGDFEMLTMVRVVREPIEAARYVFAQELIPCSDVFDCAGRLDAARSQRVALLPKSFPARRGGEGRVLRAIETPSTADVDVEVARGAPALLAISVTYHKYWRAWIDGREEKLVPANLAYQGLLVPPGRHHIRLVYRNPLVPASGAITLLAIAALVAFVAVEKRAAGHH